MCWTWAVRDYRPSSYGEGIADVYDEWYGDLADDDFVEFLVECLAETPDDRPVGPGRLRVLELGVGTGRLMEKLAARRADSHDELVGIDSSPAMLARLAAARPDLRCRAVLGDFAAELPDGPFDLVYAGFNTIFNVDDDGLDRCLALVAEQLAAGGSFVADAAIPGGSTGQHIEIRSLTAEKVVLTASRHDAANRRVEGQFIELSEAGGVRLRPWALRCWSPAELDAAADGAGLRLVGRWADGRGAPFDDDATRHVCRYVRH